MLGRLSGTIMYTFVNDMKHRLAVVVALLLTVIITKVRAGYAQCSADELMWCAKPLSVLDSGLTLVSTKADLETICPDLKEAINCIHRYTRFCMNLQDRKHFKKLFHGTGEMVNSLCKNETYQEEFLRHAPCMQMIEEQNEVCLEQYTKRISDIESHTISTIVRRKRDAADEGIKNVCCSFQEYVECSTATARRECGTEAADFGRKFLDKMSSSMIQLHCQNYGPSECGFIILSSSTHLHSASLVTTLLCILIR